MPYCSPLPISTENCTALIEIIKGILPLGSNEWESSLEILVSIS
ncbi:hypothetical protein VP01_3210g2 [Puccinia sorghi]|uniref:Uncharacterized protein n=1 Tax=Puccinia sorghi TaxID=27349 RepID=A0A0L6V086_9BASI|nr:hypothetical protein VP01_3210g2 [Puccinia sorghi]